MKQYRLTIDDSIRFFAEIAAHHAVSLFDNPYLAAYRQLHNRYALKVQFNVFLSYAPCSFSLLDFPDCYKAEFEANSDWMSFAFHARHNNPSHPYQFATAATLVQDYQEIQQQLQRIAGKAADNELVTIHYVDATKPACLALQKCGVRGFMGLFYAADQKPCTSYFLTDRQAEAVRAKGIWKDPETQLLFFCNHLVINNYSQAEMLIALQKMLDHEQEYIDLMLHEQYFYPDFCLYQSDYFAKLDKMAQILAAHGYQSVLARDILK